MKFFTFKATFFIIIKWHEVVAVVSSSPPSTSPSLAPTSTPTSTPSSMPSLMPSSMPSLMPSSEPSSMPSSMPSPTPMAKTSPTMSPTHYAASPSKSPSSEQSPTQSPIANPSCAMGIAIIDVNNDGFNDVVVGKLNSVNALLTNDGTGTFTASDLPGGTLYTRSIGAGDVNGDGFADIIVGNGMSPIYESNQLLLNDGNGAFLSSSELPGGTLWTGAIAVFDVNGDGKNDIILGNGADLMHLPGQQNQLLLNTGTDFDVINLPGGSLHTISIAVGDVDKDGDVDVVLGNYGAPNQLLRNEGNNTFSVVDLPYGDTLYTQSIAVGEVNGDGWLDIIVGNDHLFPDQLLLNDGNGAFLLATDLTGSSQTYAVSAGDANGDGFTDIAVGLYAYANQLLINDGSGAFTVQDLAGGDLPTVAIAMADLNNDNIDDIAIGNCWASDSVQFVMTTTAKKDLTNFEGKTISTSCAISQSESLPNLMCNAITDAPKDGGTIKTNLTEGTCSAGNPANMDGSNRTAVLDGGVTCKNLGTCTWTHCFRADYWYGGMHLLADMYEAVSTVTYNKDGTFTATVQTSPFAATEAITSATRSASITASLGPCTVRRMNRDLQVGIGSTLEICVYSDESNVALALRDVSTNPGSQVLVDYDGQPNFVTEVSNEGTSAVTLSTLMIPVYYDSQGGQAGSITISGTAVITYTRRHLSGGLVLDEKVESSPFELEVPLTLRENNPSVAQQSRDGSAGKFSHVNPFDMTVIVEAIGVFMLV